MTDLRERVEDDRGLIKKNSADNPRISRIPPERRRTYC